MNFERYPKILYEKKHPKPSFWLGLVLFFVGFFITVLSLNIYNPSFVPKELRVMSLDKKLNILFLGCDEVFPQDKEANGNALWKGRSDTIIVLNCNPFNNTLNILNIPRDTKIKIASLGVEKINFLNTFGGPIFTKRCLEKLLKIHIDHYVIVNLQGVNRIIDEVGGIIIDVPKRMEYHDNSAMLHINLFPGKQLLNGEQAIGYVRFRHDSLGDIGRIQRQQEFIRAVFKKLLDPITFTKLPEVVSIYKKTILTDLTPKDIIKIANFARNVSTSNQNIVMLPGEFGQYSQVSYWIPNEKEIKNITKKLFCNDNESYNCNGHFKVDPSRVKISIFNGSNKDHYLATKLTNLLREYGYTVLVAEDYNEHVTKSKIYAQKANSEVALKVKKDIGNLGELIIGNLGPPEADVTILAGDDLANVIHQVARKKG